MLLPVVVYLLSAFVHQSLQTNVTAKCCEKTLQIQETNYTLECKKKTNTRFQILAESYKFLENNSEGECIDSSGEGFFVYNVSDWKLTSKKPISTPFPKCCPMGYVYNPKMHSCSRRENVTQEFIKGSFVQVGLPRCRIILDKIIMELDSFDAISAIKSLEEGKFCLDKTEEEGFVIRECQDHLNVCKHTRCFKKCCPDGQSFVGGGNCKDTYVHGIKIESQPYTPYIDDPTDKYELIYGARCPKVSVLSKNIIQYSITKQGIYRYYHNYSGKFLEEDYSNLKSYCIEHATKGNLSGYNFFLCYGSGDALSEKFSFTFWAKVLSCIFLLVTIVVYIYLGEIKSTFGKILINYCLAVILLMLTLMVAHLHLFPSKMVCKVIGYLLIFFRSASFAWVNVMSLDIWWTFGTPRRTIGSDQKRKDLKKFLLYFLYGYGVPLCHIGLILILENTKILPESIQPYIGIYFCFLESRNYARTVFFLIPQLLFQIINTVLFIKTITYCIRVKNEINRMNDSTRNKESGKFSADKERLGLIFKLAVIMGIIWIFDVATSFFENMKSYSSFTKILEIILDNITCLQGIFIFLIFICKQKTFNSIKNKLKMTERRISCSTSVTQSSHTNGHYPMNKRQTTMSISESKM